MFDILFKTPVPDLLFPIALACLFVLLFAVNKKRPNALIRSTLRSIAIVLIGMALLGPYREQIESDISTLILLDISESMDESTAEDLLTRAATLTEGFSNRAMLPFASESAPFTLAFPNNQNLESLRGSWGRLNVGGTNIASALGTALQSDSSLVLLISDGWNNQGSLDSILEDLRLSDKAVFPLTPDTNPLSEEFKLQQIRAPLVAPQGSKVAIDVIARNTSLETQQGTVIVRQGDNILEEKTVSVPAGQEILIRTESSSSGEGIEELRAELVPDNQQMASSRVLSYLSSRSRERVLVLSGTSEDDRFLSQALREQAFEVEAHTGRISEELFQDLSRYSVIVLNNIPFTNLPAVADPRIKQFVREQGGGLLMLGGNRSFGLGNYRNTEIEEVLPVRLLPPRTEQRRLNRAVSLVIDKSRSMLQYNRMEFAREAAREAVRNLNDDDYLGVIAFDTTPFVVLPIQLLRGNRARAMDRIGTIFPVGRTNLYPAMEEARRSLVNVEAGRKHIIVMTDGILPDSGPKYLEQAQRIRMQGITVSTIMYSNERDDILQQMAEVGGGAFYQTTDGSALPRIYISDLKTSLGERTMQEASEYVVRRGDAPLTSTSIARFPPVRGYVQTEAKSGANTELVAFAGGNSEPLLVTHQSGKGKSAAFTSDANGRWSNQWVSWPLFQRFWLDLLESLRAPDQLEDDQVEFDLRHEVDGDTLILQLALFSEELIGLPISAEITGPDDRVHQVDLSAESATGKSSTELPSIIAGKHRIELRAGTTRFPPVAIHIPGDSFKEVRGRGFHLPTLYRIAEASGGEINPTRDELLGGAEPTTITEDLSRWFVFIALILLLLDILIRERGLRRRRGRRK